MVVAITGPEVAYNVIRISLWSLEKYRVSQKKCPVAIFSLNLFQRCNFTFSHVFRNQNFEPISSGHLNDTYEECLKTQTMHSWVDLLNCVHCPAWGNVHNFKSMFCTQLQSKLYWDQQPKWFWLKTVENSNRTSRTVLLLSWKLLWDSFWCTLLQLLTAQKDEIEWFCIV